MALRGMIDKGIDPSLVISIVNNKVLFPSLTLETTIPFYIYLSLNIPIRVGKLSNEVVKVIYDNNIEANIIY